MTRLGGKYWVRRYPICNSNNRSWCTWVSTLLVVGMRGSNRGNSSIGSIAWIRCRRRRSRAITLRPWTTDAIRPAMCNECQPSHNILTSFRMPSSEAQWTKIRCRLTILPTCSSRRQRCQLTAQVVVILPRPTVSSSSFRMLLLAGRVWLTAVTRTSSTWGSSSQTRRCSKHRWCCPNFNNISSSSCGRGTRNKWRRPAPTPPSNNTPSTHTNRCSESRIQNQRPI